MLLLFSEHQKVWETQVLEPILLKNVKQEVAAALQESGLMGEAGIDLITTKIGSEVAANALTGAGIGME